VALLVVEVAAAAAAAVEHSLAGAVKAVAGAAVVVARVDFCGIGCTQAQHRCASHCVGQAVGSASVWVEVGLEGDIVLVKPTEADREVCSRGEWACTGCYGAAGRCLVNS
jgi:hypothetical protein